MPDPFGTPPREVLDYFKAKKIAPVGNWQDAWNQEHATSFSVAKATSYDVQEAIYNEILKALEEGLPFTQFQKDLQPKLQQLGWWGRQEIIDPTTGEKTVFEVNPTRLRTIFDTNIATAYAAGKWEKIEKTSAALPYLLYMLGPSFIHREEHVALAGLLLPVDDQFWEKFFPPNGYGCKCWVRQISRMEAQRLLESGQAHSGQFEQIGDQLNPVMVPIRTEAPPPDYVNYTNKRTGKTYSLPFGIDPGFDTNWGMKKPSKTPTSILDSARTLDAFDSAGVRKYTNEFFADKFVEKKGKKTVEETTPLRARLSDDKLSIIIGEPGIPIKNPPVPNEDGYVAVENDVADLVSKLERLGFKLVEPIDYDTVETFRIYKPR